MTHCGLERTIYRSVQETNCIFTCFPPRHILLVSLNPNYSAPIPDQPPTNGSLYFSLAFTVCLSHPSTLKMEARSLSETSANFYTISSCLERPSLSRLAEILICVERQVPLEVWNRPALSSIRQVRGLFKKYPD